MYGKRKDMVSKHENVTEENFVTERLKKFALMVVIILIGIIVTGLMAKLGLGGPK